MSDPSHNPWDAVPNDEPNPWDDDSTTEASPLDELFRLPPDIPEPVLQAFQTDLANFIAPRIIPYHEDPIGAKKMLPDVEAFVRDRITSLVPDSIIAIHWETYLLEKLPTLLSATAMKMSIDTLTGLIKKFGLPFRVTEDDVLDFWDFYSKYSPAPATYDREWISGLELMKQWNLSPPEFSDKCSAAMPIFLWSKELDGFEFVGHRATSRRDILDYQRTDKEFLERTRRPKLWFSMPQWWHFKKSDAEFFEKLEGLATNRSKWRSCDEVAERWEASLEMIQTVIARKKQPLKAYRLDAEIGLKGVTERFLRDVTNADPLTQCLFQLGDVKDFEKRRPNKRFLGLSIRGENQRRVIKRARSLKKKNPLLNKKQIVSIIYREGLVDVTEDSIKRYLRNEHYAERGRPQKI